MWYADESLVPTVEETDSQRLWVWKESMRYPAAWFTYASQPAVKVSYSPECPVEAVEGCNRAGIGNHCVVGDL